MGALLTDRYCPTTPDGALLPEGASAAVGGVAVTVGGRVVDVVGVSGATAAQDGQCAQAGAAAVTP